MREGATVHTVTVLCSCQLASAFIAPAIERMEPVDGVGSTEYYQKQHRQLELELHLHHLTRA